MQDAKENQSIKFGKYAKALDSAGKLVLLVSFVSTFLLNDAGEALLLGLVLFFILKAISEWYLAFSYPPESGKRRFAQIVAAVLALIVCAVIALPIFIWIRNLGGGN